MDFDLERFVEAQSGGVHEEALKEIADGEKRGHWMWFVFPQLASLGFSATSKYYGLEGIDEARAYLEHPVLGQRLREISSVLLRAEGGVEDIFGYPDCLKARSCMTLFDLVEPDGVFREVLDRFYDGEPDGLTLEVVERESWPKA